MVREWWKAEEGLATIRPSPNVSLPLGLQKRRLQSPSISMALPNMTPCSPFKTNTPPHLCPPPSEGEPREKELVGGGRWCSLEKHCGCGLPGRVPFQACSESTSGEPPGPLQQFLREDSGLGGHRHPGPKASWLQSKQMAGSSFSPGPQKHHFRPSSPRLGSSWLDVSAQARLPCAELSPSLTTLILLSQSPYLFLLPPSPPPLPLFSLPSLTSPRMGLPPFLPLRQYLPLP